MFKTNKEKLTIKLIRLKAELEGLNYLMERMKSFPVAYPDRKLDLLKDIAEIEYRLENINNG